MFTKWLLVCFASVVALLHAPVAFAQHIDVFVANVGGKLATGAADIDQGEWTLGTRVYFSEFGSSGATTSPGYNALASGSVLLPSGSQALPGGTELGWDFWPMRVDDVKSNLLYWNGMDTDGVPGFTPDDVRFGLPPTTEYRISHASLSGSSFSVTGTEVAVPGGGIEITAANGTLHRHREFKLDDGDGNGATDPADGIYVIAMRMRMEGLKASLPLYVVFGTLGSDAHALDDAAFPWVTTYADTLVLLGDYNDNGIVDAADYTVWRNTLGESGFALSGDGDASQIVDAADYVVWKENFGKVSPSTLGSGTATFFVSVPEPGGVVLCLMGAGCGAFLFGRNGQVRRRRLGS
jgi:hypothetical protein